jgi:hypothetical protein
MERVRSASNLIQGRPHIIPPVSVRETRRIADTKTNHRISGLKLGWTIFVWTAFSLRVLTNILACAPLRSDATGSIDVNRHPSRPVAFSNRCAEVAAIKVTVRVTPLN